MKTSVTAAVLEFPAIKMIRLARIESPYAQVEVTLMLNKTAESYETVQPLLANYEPIIRSIVGDEISKYTTENLNENKDLIQKTIRTRLSTEFGTSDLLIAVDLNWTYDSKYFRNEISLMSGGKLE